jgi:hypothetical protein
LQAGQHLTLPFAPFSKLAKGLLCWTRWAMRAPFEIAPYQGRLLLQFSNIVRHFSCPGCIRARTLG